MIKIRYADLPAGLHIRAVARGKDTVIYLLPGLTAAQRQAALRRGAAKATGTRPAGRDRYTGRRRLASPSRNPSS